MAGKYAALSYCWGDAGELKESPNLMTTKSTLGNHQDGLDISRLPKTLHDAVVICSALGIQYVWIDALCIVQDDVSEWTMEAAKMSTVYSMAKVTIIAASSTSCNSGIIVDRLLDGEHTVNMDSSTALKMKIFEGYPRSGYHRSKYLEPKDPIDHRGWTYQEEFLSTRYLRFTQEDVQWRCCEASRCMCGNRPDNDFQRQWPLPAGRNITHWMEVVQNFSYRTFTRATDRLLAISGLARIFEPDLAWEQAAVKYTAGMWLNPKDRLIELAWRLRRRTTEDHPVDRPAKAYTVTVYIAPTFSWASVDGYVEFELKPNQERLDLCEMMEAHTELVQQGNIFGPVARAYLTVRGPLIPCHLNGWSLGDHEDASTEFPPCTGGRWWWFSPDPRLHKNGIPCALQGNHDRGRMNRMWPHTSVLFETYMLVLAAEEKERRLPLHDGNDLPRFYKIWSLAGIVLQPISLEQHIVIRVGYAYYDYKMGHTATREDFEQWRTEVTIY